VSHGEGFEKQEIGTCRYNAVKSKTGTSQEVAILVDCAFKAAREDEHKQINDFADRGLVWCGEAHFEQQKRTIFRNYFAAIPKDLQSLVVIPIVDDTLHQIGARASGYGLKEIAHFEASACGELARKEAAFASTIEDMRNISKAAANAFMRFENVRKKNAVAAPTSVSLSQVEKS
jgi:hypothetical protein